MIHIKYQLRTLHLCCGSQFLLLQDRSGTLNEVKNSHGTTNSQLDTLKDNTNRQYEDLSKKIDTLSIRLKQTVKKAVKEEVGLQLDCKLVEVERNVKTSMEERLKYVQSQEEINEMITEAIKEDKEREIRKPNLYDVQLTGIQFISIITKDQP